MNLSGLKVDKAEWNGKYTDIILRSGDNNIRLYLKGNYADFLMSDMKADKEYTLTLSEVGNKWGADALHYVFGLINQIANLLQTSKDEVYLTCLKRYSQRDILVCPVVEWAEKIKDDTYKYHEILDEREAEGVPLVVVMYWKGISKMNAYELNVFIEGVKSEAKELNIDTSTPSEKALLGENK